MRPSRRNFLERASRGASRMRNVLRRMTVSRAGAAATDASRFLWRLLGFEDDEGNVESPDAENFSGVGFYARPDATNSRPEVIVAQIGGQSNYPVVIASRDHELLKTVLAAMGVDDISADETLVFNSAAMVYIKSDGTVEARTPGGTAVPLAKGDHTHTAGTYNAPGGGGPVTGNSGASSSNTTVLKGE